MTRQGVRWRFWHLFNEMYVSSFETILFIEKAFGPQLRDHAIRMSKERYALRQRVAENGFQDADSLLARREQSPEPAGGQGTEMTSDLPSEPTPSDCEGKPI
jgi:hypothetical protein